MPFSFDGSSILSDPQLEAVLRVLIAGVLSALIGLEREMEGKPAGLRTYGLVGMGAAGFTVVGILLYGAGDPASRVGQGIVTGIGFLGAGVILHRERRVYGLTTAAGMWVAAALGMAIGGGLYVVGIGITLALIIVLQLDGLERRLHQRQRPSDNDRDGAGGGGAGGGGAVTNTTRTR